MTQIRILDVATRMRPGFYQRARTPMPKGTALDPARLNMLPPVGDFDIESPLMRLKMLIGGPIEPAEIEMDSQPLLTDNRDPLHLHERSINIYKYGGHVFKVNSTHGAKTINALPEDKIQKGSILQSFLLGAFYYSRDIPQAIVFLSKGKNVAEAFLKLGLLQVTEDISAEHILYAQILLSIEYFLGALPLTESLAEDQEGLGDVHIFSFGLDMELLGSRNREELPL